MFEEENEVANLKRGLLNFRGTQWYHKFHSRTVLTDGALYLAEQARCFWLMDVFASHLTQVSQEMGFVCLKLKREGESAHISIEDGNESLLAVQEIGYTDFPLEEMMLFASWTGRNGGCWVIMLTSEY